MNIEHEFIAEDALGETIGYLKNALLIIYNCHCDRTVDNLPEYLSLEGTIEFLEFVKNKYNE